MRYSRLKKRRNQNRYVMVVVIGAVLVGGLYIASTAAAGNFIGKMLAPILDSLNPGDAVQEPGYVEAPTDVEDEGVDLTVPEEYVDNNVEEAEPAEKVTETLEISPLRLSTIQMGAFSSRENAQALAGELQQQGGAGFILEDQFFRVLAMGFLSNADALKVKEQLKNDGIESQVYEITYQGANMQITASKKNADEIKEAFSLWQGEYSKLEGIIKDLDKNNVNSQTAYNQIDDIYKDLDKQLKDLTQLSAKQDSNYILQGLTDLYEDGIAGMDRVLSESASNRVAISAKIKYTYIDMVFLFKNYMESITNG